MCKLLRIEVEVLREQQVSISSAGNRGLGGPESSLGWEADGLGL